MTKQPFWETPAEAEAVAVSSTMAIATFPVAYIFLTAPSSLRQPVAAVKWWIMY